MSAVGDAPLGPTPAPARTPAAGRAEGVTMVRVVHSEWTKLWTLRSTRWSLLVAFLLMAATGPLVALTRMARWDRLSPAERLIDGTDQALVGSHLAPLAIGVLGVMVIAGEYATGMIHSSLMAVPRRLPVLWAKVGVFSAVGFVLMLAASLVAFVVTQPILSQHHLDASLGDPHALRAVVGSAVFLALIGAFTVAIGTIIRTTAGGIAVFAGLLFVVPGLLNLLPASTHDAIGRYMLGTLGSSMASTTVGPRDLSAGVATLVLLGYTAILLTVAAVLLRRRDA